jgi:hypothetical protein
VKFDFDASLGQDVTPLDKKKWLHYD